jgi:hypothetical protein
VGVLEKAIEVSNTLVVGTGQIPMTTIGIYA